MKDLEQGSKYLKKRGIASHRLDAEVFMASTLGIDRTELFFRHDEELPEEVVADFERKIARRGGHEPVAYITGVKEFWALPFRVGPGVLIPRPETEILIETVLKKTRGVETPLRILDIGTGSGNIAVALTRELPDARMTAVDVSEEALNYARENSRNNRVEEKIHFIQEDFLTLHASRFTLHDLIVSNPPYIASEEIGELDPTIRNFEPVLALDGGPDGLDFYRLLAKKSSSLLKPGGLLAVEIGEDQGEAVPNIFRAAGFTNIEVITDYAGSSRVVVAHSLAR